MIAAAARRIYASSGFRLTRRNAYRRIGKDRVGQTWERDLWLIHKSGCDVTSAIVVERLPGDERIAAIRMLFREYADAIGTDLEYQGFSAELAALPAPYASPGGALFIAHAGDRIAGCAALRRLDAGVGEMKRLYVRPDCRSGGVGQQLVEAVIAAARAAGYRELRLDTLPSMAAAQALYRRLGFVEIAPYNDSHLPGTRFYARMLSE